MITCLIFSDNDDCVILSPDIPVKKFYYRCDKKFIIDDAIDLYASHDYHSVILASGRIFEIYKVSPNHRELISRLKLHIPNQHRTGGQSAQRFDRMRDEAISAEVNRCMDVLYDKCIVDGLFIYESIIIAGPTGIKELLINHSIFKKNFNKYLNKIIDTSEITNNTIIDIESQISFDSSETIDIMSIIFNPSMIDKLVFGDDILTEYVTGSLSIIYTSDKNHQYDGQKTKIIYVDDPTFTRDYISMGIRYF